MNTSFLRRALCLLLVLVLFAGCTGQDSTPTEPSEPSVPAPTDPPVIAGWQAQDGNIYYILEDGSAATGWLQLDDNRYFFDSTGVMQTGWLDDQGSTYYLRPDGRAAVGIYTIDGIKHYFVATGEQFLFVNPWKSISQDYTPALTPMPSHMGYPTISVATECYDAMVAMITDCNHLSGSSAYVISAYRDYATQTVNFNKKLSQFLLQGYSQAEAYEKAAQVVAPPGTSEHHTGLAIDIVDATYGVLDQNQANTKAQKWLMENSWRYGFTLRYPVEKTDVTGIIYEPWHYRYVGVELATELYETGLTLEEYFEQLTVDS